MRSNEFNEVTLRLLKRLSETADHVTIMGFSGHWKVMPGTPNLDGGGREEVRNLKGHERFNDALAGALLDATGKPTQSRDGIVLFNDAVAGTLRDATGGFILSKKAGADPSADRTV